MCSILHIVTDNSPVSFLRENRLLRGHVHVGSIFKGLSVRPVLLEFVDGLIYCYGHAKDVMQEHCDAALLDVCEQ